MAEGGGILPLGADGIAIYRDYRDTLYHSPEDYRNTLELRGSSFYNLTIKTTHAIVRYSLGAEVRGTFYAVNEAGRRHVEHIVTECLEKKLGAGSKKTKENMEVYMYMNFSPCNYQDGKVVSRCCNKLIEFKRNHPGIDLHVRFVGLYNITRQSCLGKNCTHKKALDAKSKENKEGLRNLVAEGVHVRVFTADDWKFVHDFLCQGMPPEESPADPKPDVSGEDELQQGLEGLNLGDECQRRHQREVCPRCHEPLGSRDENEDENMQKDLDMIIKGELKKGEVEGDKGAYEKKK